MQWVMYGVQFSVPTAADMRSAYEWLYTEFWQVPWPFSACNPSFAFPLMLLVSFLAGAAITASAQSVPAPVPLSAQIARAQAKRVLLRELKHRDEAQHTDDWFDQQVEARVKLMLAAAE